MLTEVAAYLLTSKNNIIMREQRKKWEYLTIEKSRYTLEEDELNEFGNDGWELVTHNVIVSDNSQRVVQIYTFKRIKQ